MKVLTADRTVIRLRSIVNYEAAVAPAACFSSLVCPLNFTRRRLPVLRWRDDRAKTGWQDLGQFGAKEKINPE
jgi:hypothetical protein